MSRHWFLKFINKSASNYWSRFCNPNSSQTLLACLLLESLMLSIVKLLWNSFFVGNEVLSTLWQIEAEFINVSISELICMFESHMFESHSQIFIKPFLIRFAAVHIHEC